MRWRIGSGGFLFKQSRRDNFGHKEAIGPAHVAAEMKVLYMAWREAALAQPLIELAFAVA